MGIGLKPATRIGLLLALVVAGIAAMILGLPISQRGPAGKLEPISIGVPPNEQSTLIFVAEDQNLFAANGLEATIKVYDTALAALDGMKRGEVDISQTAEFPIVRQALAKEDIRIIASIDRFENIFLVARKDRGIENVADLRGKKIGAARGTLTEFHLSRFLTLHGIGLQDLTIVYMKFEESVDALANGIVDAFQVQNRDIPSIKEKIESSNLVIWPSQSNQAGYEVISGMRDRIATRQEAVKRLLISLKEAERYYASHPRESMAILQKKLNYDDAYMESIPPQHQYTLTLDQSLILAMEDEARWTIKNTPAAEKTVPDFLNHIFEDSLRAVKPEAVSIIR